MRAVDACRIVGEVTRSLEEGEVGLLEKKDVLVDVCIGSSIRGELRTVCKVYGV
jgi:predicted proteasome-type protease